MKLFEMFDAEMPGMQDVNSDNSKPVWKTSRKTRLTLSQIRKLRRMIDVRNYEKTLHLDKVRDQYGPQAEDAGDQMM
jgi:hypothetical protein